MPDVHKRYGRSSKILMALLESEEFCCFCELLMLDKNEEIILMTMLGEIFFYFFRKISFRVSFLEIYCRESSSFLLLLLCY